MICTMLQAATTRHISASTTWDYKVEEPDQLVEPMATSSDTQDLSEEISISAVKEQLLTQALPPYVPSAASEEQLFDCPDCGDRFLLEASLVRHLDRRSVFIAYGCRVCNCSLEFYNRCALLAHLRGHSLHSTDLSPAEQLSKLPQTKITLGPLTNNENGEITTASHSQTVVELDSLLLSPVPRSKIDIGPFVPIPVDQYGRLLSKSNSNVSEVEKISQGVQVTDGCDLSSTLEKNSESPQLFSLLSNDKADKQASNLSASETTSSGKKVSEASAKSSASATNMECENEAVESSKLSTDPPSLDVLISESEVQASKECKECGKIPSDGDLKDHYQSFNAPLLSELSCALCKLILPSRCSLMAHKRVHLQKHPFICPECAREFSLWASFYVHMLYTCFHMFKEVRYRCMQCRSLFVSELSLQTHLVASHVKHVFKCDVCPIACFSTQTLREHKVNTHGQSTLSTHSYQQCQLCPDRLIPKHKILSHVAEHSAYPAVRVYVYKCNTCSHFTVKKTDFATHKSNCTKAHGQSNKSSMATNKFLLGKNWNQKNCFKIFCEVPQSNNNNSNNNNNMKISFVPKSVVQKVSMNKIVWAESETKDMLPKSVAQNVNKVHLTDSETKEVLSKISVAKGKSLLLAGDKVVDNKTSAVMKREQIYFSDSLKPRKAKQLDANATLLSKSEKGGKEVTVLNKVKLDSKTSESNVYTAEGTVTKPANITLKPQKIIQSCAVCDKAIPYYVHSSFKAKLPVICAACSRDHAFVRKGGKLLIVPKKSLESFAKVSEAIINSKPKAIAEKDIVNSNSKSDAGSNATMNNMVDTKWKSVSEGKYKCHVCKMLVSMDHDKMKQHFRDKHPDLKLLVPTVNKIKINSTLMKLLSCSDGDMNLQKEGHKEPLHAESEEDSTKFNQVIKRSFDSADIEEHNDSDLKSKRKKKNLQKLTENASENTSTLNSGQEIPLFESGERKFICFKCKYTDRNEKSFHEHILKHRNDDNAYQCMECGMCFVVRPSFEKHLFIWHRIKDAEAYIQANDCCNRSLREDSPEEFDSLYSMDEDEENGQESLTENQCRVCKEMFESSSQLNMHFRTHGMAFLLMKRREIRQANNVKL